MPTEQELAAQFNQILASFTEKFGPGQLDQFVRAAMKVAHLRAEQDCPHLEIKSNFTWSSKLRPEPKKKKAVAPTLFN
jgi:hypothetical protein